jgi:hypothetical protein
MERILTIGLASLLALSGAVLVSDLAFLRPAMERRVDGYVVTGCPFELRAEPRMSAPAVCRLGKGAEFRLSRRRSGDDWVYAMVGPEAGWVETSALRERAVRQPER